MHVHLDPIGGIAGDMFAAALLDYHPGWRSDLIQAIGGSGLAPGLSVNAVSHNNGSLSGHRFEVSIPDDQTGHDHSHWHEIRRRLRNCNLPPAVKQRALTIFTLLAEAEAHVHEIEVERVVFHEVGAWDSIADILAAAWLIEQSGATGWSCTALPMGRGWIDSAHGRLPLPAPATANLLQSYPLYDDGVQGERITPTGAAILKHLDPTFEAIGPVGLLLGQGHGFGQKCFAEFSNLLRVCVFDDRQTGVAQGQVLVCQFEVDDQTPEDLAVGLDQLRELPGVLDVVQSPVFGKKGRMAAQIQLLGEPARQQAIVDCCLTETTTLGVRWQLVNRTTLVRDERSYALGDGEVRVKRAARPDGTVTCKAEMDDLMHTSSGHAGREQRRQQVHSRDLEQSNEIGNDPDRAE